MAVLRKIRIGSDITLGITVMASGHAVDWNSQDIKHVYAFSDVQGQPVAEMSYEQRGSTLRCVFHAEDQNYVGAYRVIIEFNDGSAFSSTLDMPAFEIVRTSDEADIDTGEIVLDIDGSMRFYSLAEVISKLEGLHAEVKAAASAAREASDNANAAAKKANDAAALANSNASKAEASNKVINDNERKRIAQETARESAEAERKRAELERQKGDESIAIKEAERERNEEVRETNEQTREDNELERRNAESARNRAETQRANSETKRISNETSRQAAENKRVAAETSRQEAETSRVNVESERVTEFARLKKESEEATKAASAVSDVVAQHTVKINGLTETTETKFSELGMIINEIADTSIQPPVEGKNLFNVATIKDGYNVSDSGGEFANEDQSISEYISISGTTNIVVSATINIQNNIKFALYDASKATIVGSVLRIPTLTLDSSIQRYYYAIATNGAAYIRFSALTEYFPIRKFQIEKGTTPTSFEDYIDPTPQVSAQVKEIAIPQYTEYKQKVDALDGIVSVSVCRNRFEGTYVQKKYINQTNGVSTSGDNYGHTNFINIEGDSEFVVVSSMRSMVSGAIRYAQYTDKSEDSFIPNSGAVVSDASLFILDPATGRTYFKIPRNPNAKYLRFSCVLSMFTSGLYDMQVELASIPTSYEKYCEPTKTINQKFLQTAKGSFGSKSSLASGEMLTLDTNCVKKNKRLAFLAKINSFSAVEVGHGASSSYGFYMKVDSEKVYFVQNGTSGSSLTHGLTINGYIGVVIKVGNQGNFSFTINTQSAKYESPREYSGWKGYQGAIFAKSVGSSLTDCTLSWMCEDYEKDIYMFGDSYFSHEAQTRWPYWMINWGFDNALMDAYPGKASAEAYDSFLNALEHKIPKFVVWCLGMSDPDSTTEVNPTWKSVVEKVIGKCNTYGITPILATIPNTPSDIYSNNFKNAYIKESGYRYIDFANAVGAEERGSGWDYDYLETGANPNIHPSANGARVLALRALTDVPELMG